MTAPADTLTLLLPERRRFAGQGIGRDWAARLGRANLQPAGETGERAQILRHVDLLPRAWPMAAITRQYDARDASLNSWLRADPAHVRADMGSARLMACGELGLSADEAQELIAPLRPLFGDTGFPISAPVPQRWYLMLPKEAHLPVFVPPSEALGADIFGLLPEGPDGKRWRALMNEAQILLHNHPLNAQRIEAGRLPVNSLWFWGAGVLPDQVRFRAAALQSDDIELQALAALAGIGTRPDGVPGSHLLDLRPHRDWARLESAVLDALLPELGRRYAAIELDFADGARFRLEARQRWRFWRRPIARFA